MLSSVITILIAVTNVAVADAGAFNPSVGIQADDEPNNLESYTDVWEATTSASVSNVSLVSPLPSVSPSADEDEKDTEEDSDKDEDNEDAADKEKRLFFWGLRPYPLRPHRPLRPLWPQRNSTTSRTLAPGEDTSTDIPVTSSVPTKTAHHVRPHRGSHFRPRPGVHVRHGRHGVRKHHKRDEDVGEVAISPEVDDEADVPVELSQPSNTPEVENDKRHFLPHFLPHRPHKPKWPIPGNSTTTVPVFSVETTFRLPITTTNPGPPKWPHHPSHHKKPKLPKFKGLPKHHKRDDGNDNEDGDDELENVESIALYTGSLPPASEWGSNAPTASFEADFTIAVSELGEFPTDAPLIDPVPESSYEASNTTSIDPSSVITDAPVPGETNSVYTVTELLGPGVFTRYVVTAPQEFNLEKRNVFGWFQLLLSKLNIPCTLPTGWGFLTNLPSVSLPAVSLLSVKTPSLSVPALTTPSISLPNVPSNIPAVTTGLPTLSLPNAGLPTTGLPINI